MKIYFYTNQEVDNQAAKEIFFCLKRAGIEIITNNSKNKNIDNDFILPKVEAMIFQGKTLDAKSSYLLAFSLAQNKKVLCLLPEGASVDSNWANLQSMETMSDKISLEFYDNKNIKEKVYGFLKKLDASSAKELFNIKYTLRISQKISQYLNFKARESSTPKADWLRDQLVKMMEEDKNYNDFEDNKFEVKKE